MKLRIRLIAIALAAAASAGGPGCSNLVVKKVPLEKRASGTDHQQGFRYYLNRPYLAVRDPVLIFERRTLVDVKGKAANALTVTYLEGERKGQSVKLADFKVKSGGDAFRAVTAEELSKIRAALASKAASTPSTLPHAAPAPAAGRDAQLARASATSIDRIAMNRLQNASPQGQPGAPLPGGPMTITPARNVGTTFDTGGAASGDAGAGGAATGGGASSVDSNASSTQYLTDAKIVGTIPDDDVLTGAIQVVYLPDLDEQYVIKSKNWLAKSTFALAFRNGTELAQVDAEHDATTVTIALLDLLQTAIGTAAQVAQTGIQQSAQSKKSAQQSGPAGGQDTGGGPPPPTDKTQIYQMVERVYIKPGLYRLNKPWEISGPGCDTPTGMGLLAKLGLPTESDVYFTRIADLSN